MNPPYSDRVELARAIPDVNEKFVDGLAWKLNRVFHFLPGLSEEVASFYIDEVINPLVRKK